MPKPNIYVQVDYDGYKKLEQQLKPKCGNCGAMPSLDIERSHSSEGKGVKFYHNSLRLDCGEFTIEIQGPLVQEPMRLVVPESLEEETR